MRFKSRKSGGFQVFAVSGTNTVSFAIDASAAARKGLLGFAVERIKIKELGNDWIQVESGDIAAEDCRPLDLGDVDCGRVIAGDDLTERKPSPEPLFEVARRLNLPASALALVGDSPQDVLCARAAGALSIGVRGGILPEALLVASEPDHLLDDLTALPALAADYGFVP